MARITVEDCLKEIPSRFALVHIASQRARRLVKGARPLVNCDNKVVVTALREVADGLVTVETGAEAEGAAQAPPLDHPRHPETTGGETTAPEAVVEAREE